MTKPAKPTTDFPLFAHSSGKWAKRIRGKVKYFGRWADPLGALAEYQNFVAQQSVQCSAGLTVKDLANRYLAAKEQAKDRGEIAPKTWIEYRDTCVRFAGQVGPEFLVSRLTPDHFSDFKDWRSQRCSLVAIGNEIKRVRMLFKWGLEHQLISQVPQYGQGFKKASARLIRKHRRESGKKLFTADQIHRLLEESGIQMRAMILLGINCGLGNTDCAQMPLAAIQDGWLDYPRPKTEVERRAPLWPETQEAIRVWLARRETRDGDTVSLFLLPGDAANSISKRFRQVLLWSGVKRGGFYWLRHTFETIAGGSKDQVAVGSVMGHVDWTMAAVYREEIADERLSEVVEHVRGWLFGS